ncbi:MAG: hypothetical protein HKN93_03275 [Acidimicrobiia bacterium]|nr:hypothetical protein [Acidimicrobiia bacterium]
MGDTPSTGWILGLGLIPGSWVAAGIVSTFLPEPESAFPWALLGFVLAWVVALVVVTLRMPGLRRTAWLGAGVSLLVASLLFLAIVLASP